MEVEFHAVCKLREEKKKEKSSGVSACARQRTDTCHFCYLGSDLHAGRIYRELLLLSVAFVIVVLSMNLFFQLRVRRVDGAWA